MPLITCLNGHEIELQPNQFGQRIACPLCQLMIVVSPPRANEPLFPKYEVLCENGHVLRVKSKYLGTQIRCPQCKGLAWVTTDRLQRNAAQLTHDPVVPIVLPDPSIARLGTPLATGVPTAPALDNIPVAELDETPKLTRKKLPRHLDDDDEEDGDSDDLELTKSERRNMHLLDQGLGYYLGGVIGLLCTVMVGVVLLVFMALISQGVSTADGARSLATVAEIIGWFIIVAIVLNVMLLVAGQVLTVFAPWITGATIWFILSLILTVGLIGYRLFVLIQDGSFRSMMASSMMNAGEGDKILYYVHQALGMMTWLLMLLGLWQLAKYARKPLTRQRVMLLGMLGVGIVIASHIIQLLLSNYPPMSTAGRWVVLIILTFLTLGVGALLIYQHLTVINEVRTIMYRRKRR